MNGPAPNADMTPENQGNPPIPTQGSALDTLLEAAILAPSGDNLQPWRFHVDCEHRAITLDVDPDRDPSPMNAGQRMSRISLGAALENMVRTAEHHGWGYEIQESSGPGLVTFSVAKDTGPAMIEPLLYARVTNRRVYDGTELPNDLLQRLSGPGRELPSVRVTVITDRSRRSRFVELIAKADALMLTNHKIRAAFLANVRFDVAPNAKVTEGLSLGSLEVSASDRAFLRLMKSWSIPDRLLRMLGARSTFARVARKLAGSASGFCVVTALDRGPMIDIQTGRAWQDKWLAFTHEGLFAQPMMSLLVLQNILEVEAPDFFSCSDREVASELVGSFQKLANGSSEGYPAAMMRFGFAASPQTRVGRLSPEQLAS